MKKIFSSFIVLSFLFCFVLEGYAADQLHRVTHNDQDALIIGQINRQEDSDYIVNVMHIISGKLDETTIKVSKGFKYEHLNTNPSIDDFAIFSLDKRALGYKVKYGVYKSDSGDYKALKLIKTTDISHGQRGDVIALEYYINSNGEEGNFSFEGTTAYVTDKSGERKMIYSATDEEEKIKEYQEVQKNIEAPQDNSTKDKTDTIVKVKKVNNNSNESKNSNYIYIGLILIFIVAIVFLIDRRTNKK